MCLPVVRRSDEDAARYHTRAHIINDADHDRGIRAPFHAAGYVQVLINQPPSNFPVGTPLGSACREPNRPTDRQAPRPTPDYYLYLAHEWCVRPAELLLSVG